MASNSTVHKSPYAVCKQVSDLCPVAATTLGYYPNEGLNIFFAVGFGLAAVITLVFGVWKRTWSFMAFIVAGCFLELAGVYFPLCDSARIKCGKCAEAVQSSTATASFAHPTGVLLVQRCNHRLVQMESTN